MKRFYLDLALLIMFLAVMSFHFIPKVLHEILGLLMFVAAAVHFYWNRRALRSISKICLAIDILIIVGLLAITITGVCISNHLFNGLIDMKIQRNIFIHQLHVSLPFALMIAFGLHFGRNWQSFCRRLPFEINSLVGKAIGIALIIAGLIGAHMNQLVDRLLMKHIFGTPATQLNGAIYVLLLLGMVALFTSIGFAFNRLIKKV